MLGDRTVTIYVNLTKNLVKAVRSCGVFGTFDALAGRDVVQDIVYEFLSLEPVQQTIAVRVILVPYLDYQSFQGVVH